LVFSKELDAIRKESHRSPRPTFGAPTLMWHIGIWPAPEYDWLDAAVNVSLNQDAESRAKVYTEIYERDSNNKKKFFEGFNRIVQRLCGIEANQFRHHTSEIKLDDPPGWVESANFANDQETLKPQIFPVVQENSLAFTLWWYSKNFEGEGAHGVEPKPSALRVRVQVEAHRDHITLTFYLDAGKPWNEDRVYGSSDAQGVLRKRIFAEIESVRSLCEDRARTRDPIEPLVPERELGDDPADSERKASKLLAAADFIYEDIWDAFLEDFGITLKEIATPQGEIFANFRTAVVSTVGVPTQESEENHNRDAFQRFDSNSNECNAVLRGFWPFVRRMTPYADEKEHVACAVMGYRALYITALNAYTNYVEGQETRTRLQEVPAGALPEMPDPSNPACVVPPGSERFENRPMRALVLTKGEPNTHQVGRILERFNSLGTMRFFALKSYPLVRDASNHIRICGERLDEIVGVWTRKRDQIERKYPVQTDREDNPDAIILTQEQNDEKQQQNDEKNQRLSDLANLTEKYLLDIHADLDSVSKRIPGGLLFRVSRSIFYADQIRIVVKLLKIENIETWVTYEQFLDRTVLPTFEFIRRTGQRLEALRDRLQVITQSIQTSSVYLQTLATRQNTEQLRNLASAQEKLARQQGRTNLVFTGLGLLITAITADEIFESFARMWNALSVVIGAS